MIACSSYVCARLCHAHGWLLTYRKWPGVICLPQDYLCHQLLGWDTAGQAHDAAFDATKSMRLYHLYHHLQQDPAAWQHAQARLLTSISLHVVVELSITELSIQYAMAVPTRRGDASLTTEVDLQCRKRYWRARHPRPLQRHTPHLRASARGTARHANAAILSSHDRSSGVSSAFGRYSFLRPLLFSLIQCEVVTNA